MEGLNCNIIIHTKSLQSSNPRESQDHLNHFILMSCLEVCLVILVIESQRPYSTFQALDPFFFSPPTRQGELVPHSFALEGVMRSPGFCQIEWYRPWNIETEQMQRDSFGQWPHATTWHLWFPILSGPTPAVGQDRPTFQSFHETTRSPSPRAVTTSSWVASIWNLHSNKKAWKFLQIVPVVHKPVSLLCRLYVFVYCMLFTCCSSSPWDSEDSY